MLDTGNFRDKEVFILGRYSFDLKNRIKNEDNFFTINAVVNIVHYTKRDATGNIQKISAKFMTVHKAKGLEADIVIILNCNSGKLGFPSEISDDPVLNLLLSEADQFENGEERRLFYVAMTRAKEMVYFVSDSSYKSKFIAELEVESVDNAIKKCPQCRTADLVKKQGPNSTFYGCSNFMYGCTYKEWID